MSTARPPPGGTFTQVSAGAFTPAGSRAAAPWPAGGPTLRAQPRPPAAPLVSLALARAAATRARSRAAAPWPCWGFAGDDETAPPAGLLTQVSAGDDHTCGVKSDGTVACWGFNGNGEATPPAGRFTQVSEADSVTPAGSRATAPWSAGGQALSDKPRPPPGRFTQVSAGFFHTCGVKTDGTLACWGSNFVGEANPPVGLFTQVIAGAAHNCAIKSDGTVACWGDNSFGQATPPGGRFTQISAGGFHTCGLTSDGTLSCWGDNSLGQGRPRPLRASSLRSAQVLLHLRGPERRHPGLLGEQQLRAGDAPRTANDDGAKPRASVARAEEQRCRRVASGP